MYINIYMYNVYVYVTIYIYDIYILIYIYGFLSHGLPPNHPNGPFQTLNPWWHGDPPCRSCPGQALADQRKPLEAADDTIFQLEVRGEKSPPPRSFPTSVEIVYSILYYMIYIYWYDMIWHDMIWYENGSHKPPRKGSAQARPLERNIQLTAALAASLVPVADCWLYFQWLSGFRMFRTSFSPVESLQKCPNFSG